MAKDLLSAKESLRQVQPFFPDDAGALYARNVAIKSLGMYEFFYRRNSFRSQDPKAQAKEDLNVTEQRGNSDR